MTAFGRYELLGRLAMGGMAEIFRARQRGDGGFVKDVVIKRVLPHYAEDQNFIAMFIDEAVLAAKLNHPNVVSVFDFGHVESSFFIAMEYVEGVDLRRLQALGIEMGEPIGINRAVQIAMSICRGLAHAHEREENGLPLRIVHRDVSPHNVLVSVTGDVKVMDFGIAKAAARATHTGTGIVKGKLAYMAPEQIRGGELDHRVDIFATGIVIWEILSGRRLYEGGSELEIFEKVKNADIPDVRVHAPDVPESLSRVLDKLMQKDPAQRYQSLREAERDLAQVLHQLGGAFAFPLEDYARRAIAFMQQDQPVQTASHALSTSARTSAQTSQSADLAPVTDAEMTRTPQRGTPQPGGLTAAAPVTTLHKVNARSVPLGWVLLGVVLLVGVTVALTLSLKETKAPEPAQLTNNVVITQPELPAPPKEEPVVVPPQEKEPEPVVAKEKEKEKEKKKKDKPAVEAAPSKKEGGWVSFVGCTSGLQVSEGGKKLPSLSAGNIHRYPLPAGRHVLTLRTEDGRAISLPAVTVNLNETEIVDCP